MSYAFPESDFLSDLIRSLYLETASFKFVLYFIYAFIHFKATQSVDQLLDALKTCCDMFCGIVSIVYNGISVGGHIVAVFHRVAPGRIKLLLHPHGNYHAMFIMA